MSSIQERLQAARDTAERTHPVSLPLPGFQNNELVIRYRAPDWAASRNYIKAQIQDAPGSVELEAIADGLVAASTGAEAHLDGEVHDLPYKLGVDLAEYLGVDVMADTRRISDREAVFLLIPDDMDLVAHWNELIAESRQAKDRVEADITGESQAS